MLPKKNRADKKTIEKIFKKSIFIGSHSLNLKYFFNKDFVGVFIFNKQKEKNLPEVIEEDIKIILNKI